MFLVTLLTDNDYRRCGKQIAENTFVCDRGPETGVLHTFFNESSVRELFKGRFEIESTDTAKGTNTIENDNEVIMEFFRIKARRRQ